MSAGTSAGTAPPDGRLRHGTPAFRRASLALFAAGLATFALLYCVQPLLPVFSAEFQVSPATASLSLSLATAGLAVAMVVVGATTDGWARKKVMAGSIAAASLLGLAAALSPTFGALLLLRLLEGIALAGVPAVALAYLSEELHPDSLGLGVGLYISGTTIGGMLGRLLSGALTDALSWRAALALVGLLGLAASLTLWRSLPPSAAARPAVGPHRALAMLRRAVGDPALLLLYAAAALLMGSFVTVYNYIGYRLVAPPYLLSQTEVAWVFLLYLVGTFSSAWMGRLADRLGRRRVFWVAVTVMLVGAVVTLAASLPLIVLGVAVLTFGFFGAHSIASSWVGRRAPGARAQASSLYLLCYYAGGSLAGSAGGLIWAAQGWSGIVLLVGALLGLTLLLATRLSAIRPLDAGPAPSAAG